MKQQLCIGKCADAHADDRQGLIGSVSFLCEPVDESDCDLEAFIEEDGELRCGGPLHLGPDILVFVNSVKLLRVKIPGA